MNIYVYSDESGVFDRVHNHYFVYGGLIIIGSDSKEEWSRKYAAAEKTIRETGKYNSSYELKATSVSNKEKSKLFRSLNQCYKFGCVVDQDRILSNIWNQKKDKQRYLDYAYKIGIKRAFQDLISREIINPPDVSRLYFSVDEHTTATSGKYELQEGLEQEFRFGTFNYNYLKYFPPIFPALTECKVDFCDSSAPNKRLVRASDFVANHIYYLLVSGQADKLEAIQNLYMSYLP